jgi:Ca-activated chloride channel family protein
MVFDNPQMFFALFLLVPGTAFAWFHYRQYRKVLSVFTASMPDAGRDTLIGKRCFRYWVSVFFFYLFFGCGVTALAGPRWGSRPAPELGREVDVVLAVDLSRSMDVRDVLISPEGTALSRLERARAVAEDLVNHSPGIRFGIAVGKGGGILAVPLTHDTEAVVSFLKGLSGRVITGRGTNLERLVDAAAGAFQDALPTRRRIILFSDGEPLAGSLQAALDRARKANIAVITLGFGSEEGGPVPVTDDYLLGEAGSPVISSLRRETLETAAKRTGGIYVDGNRNDALSLLTEHLASFSPESILRGYRWELSPRWHYFVIAALAALGISKILERWYDRI